MSVNITFVSHCMQTAVRGSPAEAKPIEPLGNRVVTYISPSRAGRDPYISNE
jgi:hypothetical protein